jgi:hypothetical protein
MGYVSINDVLAAPNLLGLLHLAKSGIPDVFPDSFKSNKKRCDKDYGEWKTDYGMRQVVPATQYGSESKTQQQQKMGVQTAKLIFTSNNLRIPVSDFMNLLAFESLEKQKLGAEEVVRQVQYAKTALANNRTAITASALFTGAVYYDKFGNLLPNSTNADLTVNFNVPTANQGQCNILGTGNTLTQGWQDAGVASSLTNAGNPADIDFQVKNLKTQVLYNTGYDLKHAFYGINVSSYLTYNTLLAQYFRFNVDGKSAYNPAFVETGDLPMTLFGLQWHPAYNQYYLDQNQAKQTFVAPSAVLFTPDPAECNFLQNLEGTYAVPNTYGPVAAESVTSNFTEVQGQFVYAKPVDDPVTAKIIYGDTFLPAVCNPQVIVQATTNFGS